MRESDRCFSAAKLFFAYGLGNALVHAVRGRRHVDPAALMPPTAPRVYEIIARHKPTLFFSVPTQLRDAAGTRRRCSISRAFRYAVSAGRGVAGAAVPPLQAAVRRRDPRCASARPSACTCSSPIILAACGPDRAASSCRVTRRASSTSDDQPVPVGEMGNLLIKGDSTVRVLLEPAREDQADDPGRMDSHRRQAITATPTAITGTAAAATTC